ncbi:MAG: carboxypeptidase-like regulatory domain-containing protein, partial [Bacteroidota bacterium]
MRLFILSLLLATAASAQTGTLSGIVTDDETGEALAGAAVVVAGTSLGAATNLDGRYRIGRVPVGRQTLRFSFVGFTP